MINCAEIASTSLPLRYKQIYTHIVKEKRGGGTWQPLPLLVTTRQVVCLFYRYNFTELALGTWQLGKCVSIQVVLHFK